MYYSVNKMGEHLISFWEDYNLENFKLVHDKTYAIFKGKVWDKDILEFLITTSHKSNQNLPIRFLHENYTWAGRYDIFNDPIYSPIKKEFQISYHASFYTDLMKNGNWNYIFKNLSWKKPYPKQTVIWLNTRAKSLDFYKNQVLSYSDSIGTYEFDRFMESFEICVSPHPLKSEEDTKRYVAHNFITFLLSRSYRLTIEAFIKSNKITEISGKWVSEFKLYIRLKSHFIDDTVLYQSSPSFLMGQRFDVWIPTKRVAVEYNGIQHYEPVEIFGGIEGFKQTIARDEAKREKCKIEGIHLIEVREGYDFEHLVSRINDCEK